MDRCTRRRAVLALLQSSSCQTQASAWNQVVRWLLVLCSLLPRRQTRKADFPCRRTPGGCRHRHRKALRRDAHHQTHTYGILSLRPSGGLPRQSAWLSASCKAWRITWDHASYITWSSPYTLNTSWGCRWLWGIPLWQDVDSFIYYTPTKNLGGQSNHA